MEFNGTFFATILTFLVFVFVMNKILYIPVRNIVNQRNKYIDDNYSSAEENDKKSEELSIKREEGLLNAKENARTKYNELVNEYKKQKAEIVNSAQNDTNSELNVVYENLNNVSNETKEQLKGHMSDLANDIVEKVLGYRTEVQGFDNDAVNDILYQ